MNNAYTRDQTPTVDESAGPERPRTGQERPNPPRDGVGAGPQGRNSYGRGQTLTAAGALGGEGRDAPLDRTKLGRAAETPAVVRNTDGNSSSEKAQQALVPPSGRQTGWLGNLGLPSGSGTGWLGSLGLPSGSGTGWLGILAPRLAGCPAELGNLAFRLVACVLSLGSLGLPSGSGTGWLGNLALRLVACVLSLGNLAPRLLPRGRFLGNFGPRLRGALFPSRSQVPQRAAQTGSEVPQLMSDRPGWGPSFPLWRCPAGFIA